MTVVLLRIEDLKGHEKIDQRHLLRLERLIRKESVQRDPIVVDGKTKVVLDGHHRIEIFRRMGLKKIAAYQVDYLSDDRIKVKSWYPVLMAPARNVAKLLGINPDAQSKRTNHSEIFLISKQGNFSLGKNRYHVMERLVGRLNMHYSASLLQAKRLVRLGRASGFISLPSVKKKQVMQRALRKVKFPPKTTRHIIPRRPTKIFLPLHSLKGL